MSYAIGNLFIFPVASLAKKRMFLFQSAARGWAKFLVWVSRNPVTIEGVENIPKKEPVIFVSNHQGWADILALLAFIPRNFRFLIKKELFKVPFFGCYLKNAGYLSVEREAGHKAYRIFSEAEKVLAAGECILIFPEGTRTRDGNLQPFKRGSLLIASKTKARIVPVAISGSFNILPPKKLLLSRFPVKYKIGKPISAEKYGTDYEKAASEVHQAIKSMLSEHR